MGNMCAVLFLMYVWLVATAVLSNFTLCLMAMCLNLLNGVVTMVCTLYKPLVVHVLFSKDNEK